MRKIRICLFLAALTLLFMPSMAQENNPTGEPEYREGVYVGGTSTERTDKEMPTDVDVTETSAPATADVPAAVNAANAKKLAQQKKAENLKKNDSYGGAITLMSMLVVIAALAVLSILFFFFGRISSAIQKKRKKAVHSTQAAQDELSTPDSGEEIAAIAAALAEHFSGKHDMEDTILTIKRMKRSYSPWNSKIYNIRVIPTVRR